MYKIKDCGFCIILYYGTCVEELSLVIKIKILVY